MGFKRIVENEGIVKGVEHKEKDEHENKNANANANADEKAEEEILKSAALYANQEKQETDGTNFSAKGSLIITSDTKSIGRNDDKDMDIDKDPSKKYKYKYKATCTRKCKCRQQYNKISTRSEKQS